jgi:acetylornithine deacetylase/succinyl-diaminopimelate desuccinylase-like protein
MPHTSDKSVDYYKKLFRAQETEFLDEYFTFLRFPTISADPAFRPQIRECAKWLELLLSERGFQVELWNEDDAPIVFASYDRAGPDKPTLLIYNHYDVQPVDPRELWHHDPFLPHKDGNQIFARGAQDNKGQCFYVLSALSSYLKHEKKLPINVKWIIEGEEESGSAGLSKVLNEKKDKLKSDYLLVVDLGMRQAHIPAITLGTRGLVSLEVEVKGTRADLHSGSHGGLAYNPLHALSELIASLRDHRGVIQVPGFYDNVSRLNAEELSKINFNFNEAEYKEHFGAVPTGGEKGFSPLQRGWLRPTVEVNGMGGGYQGPGAKTVIPAIAHAKLSCRLVPDQDPKQIAELIKNYLEALAPHGIVVNVTINEGMGRPVRTKHDAKIVKALEKACEDVYWQKCEYILEGASIPIVSEFADCLDTEIALFGLGLANDNIHSPNESFSWDRIEKGFLVISKTLDELAS